MDEQEQKRLVCKTFDTIANGYDGKARKFFKATAEELPGYLRLRGDEHVLDVATGTGNVAMALSRALPNGQITGVDFSEGMLSKAREKVALAGMQNISLLSMDMQALDFPENHFDAAVSSFGIFFVQDMTRQLRHIAEKVKKNGTVLITCFHESTFSPMIQMFLERLKKYGVTVNMESLKRLPTKKECIALFEHAGLVDISADIKELGYYLDGADQWWDIVWNAGLRRYVTQLPPERIEQFRDEHMQEVETLSTENGIWLEVNIIFTTGRKP